MIREIDKVRQETDYLKLLLLKVSQQAPESWGVLSFFIFSDAVSIDTV